jgi:Flp pilus assembly protein TadG
MKFLMHFRSPVTSRSLRRGERGQSLVEFAIALPFMLILIIVMLEVGFLLRTHTGVVSTVRESARISSAVGNADPYDSNYIRLW